MDLWLPVIAATFFLYVPGFLILRGARFSWLVSLSAAPFVDVLFYVLLGVLYQKVGVFCTWYLVVSPVLVLGLLICAVSGWFSHKERLRKNASRNDSGSLLNDYDGLSPLGGEMKESISAVGKSISSQKMQDFCSEGNSVRAKKRFPVIDIPFERTWSEELMYHAVAAQQTVTSKPRFLQQLLMRIYIFLARLCDKRVFDVTGAFCAVFSGVMVIGVLYAFGLVDINASSQEYDNAFHLGTVYSFATSGNWSTFGASLYPTSPEAAYNPLFVSGFYPYVYSEVAAMLMSLLSLNSISAINAANITIVSIVYPLSMYFFLRVVFKSRPAVALLGSFITPAFIAFPWWFMVFGPLYPNMFAFALVPVGAGLAVLAFQQTKGSSNSISYFVRVFVLLLICLASNVFIQPNAVFTTGVWVAAYLVFQAFVLTRARREKIDGHRAGLRAFFSNPWVVATGVALGILIAWFAVCSLPGLQLVVTHWWPSIKTRPEALMALVTLAYNTGVPQYLLASLVAVGVVLALRKESWRWLVVSWLIFNFLYVIAAATDTPLKPFFTGVWYSDSYRIAAAAILAAVPLAALGLYGVSKLCVSGFTFLVTQISSRESNVGSSSGKESEDAESQRAAACTEGAKSKRVLRGNADSEFSKDEGGCAPESYQAARMVAQIMVAIGLCILCYVPSFSEITSSDGGSQLRCAALTISGSRNISGDRVYDNKEREFVHRVKNIVPPGSVLLNEPDDGSVFAYGVDGAPVYYRFLRDYDVPTETRESKAIRTRLNRVTTDKEVQQAVNKIGADYLLVLDKQRGNEVPRLFTYADNEPLWRGIAQIDDDTPGFEVVLAQDDMRLYRIKKDWASSE